MLEKLFRKEKFTKLNETDRKIMQQFQVDPWINNYILTKHFATQQESFDEDSDVEKLEVEKWEQ